MVKKLLKHEAKYYSRTLIIYEIVMLGLALFARLLMFIETDTAMYHILQGGTFTIFGFSLFGCILMALVVSVTRFHKNLFSTEGYLTFSLPVSTHQHIISKLIAAVTYNVIVHISAIVALSISISGDVLTEVIKAANFLINDFAKKCDDPFILHLVFYVIEAIIIAIVSIASSLLLYYCCDTIGQTAKKNRILLAVAAYFGYGIITQFLGTFFTIFLTAVGDSIPYEEIVEYIAKNPFESVHIFMLIGLVLTALLATLFYFITYRIISRKLNLE